MEYKSNKLIKPCPFCGKKVDLNDEDTLYPNGIGWKVRKNGWKSYCSSKEVPKEQWCWSMHCVTAQGGCGVEMSADTQEQAIEKWNTRVCKTTNPKHTQGA